jgi:membrane-bound serine protease (ClpP class)
VPNQDVVFSKLPLGDRLVHTLTSPSIALLMLIAGLALVLFEFYTAGIAVAGVTGALALVGAFAGFAHLPVRWWAVALVVLAFVAFAVELQVGTLGPYTVLGLLLLTAGSWWMYGGSDRLDPPLWVLAALVVATGIFIVGGMTAMIRSRFSTPTIGREALVGEMGLAVEAVDPEGIVEIEGARWRALTNRATPIEAGEPVRVVAVDGFALEVEPETGGARDHRERRRSVADAPHPG